MGESVTKLRLRPAIPISETVILQGAAQKLAIAGRGDSAYRIFAE